MKAKGLSEGDLERMEGRKEVEKNWGKQIGKKTREKMSSGG